MFDVGFSELVVIALVALIVLGPKRLPEVARTAGQWLARFRRFVSDVKQDFDREMQHADLAELHKLKQELDETRRTMEEASSRLMQQASIEPPPLPASNAAEPASVPAPTPTMTPLAAPATSAVTTSPPASPVQPSRRRGGGKKRGGAPKRNPPKGKNGGTG